jgi:hypothetical protein
MNFWKTAIACTLSGALTASQVGAVTAAPMPTNVAAMKSVVADGPGFIGTEAGADGVSEQAFWPAL